MVQTAGSLEQRATGLRHSLTQCTDNPANDHPVIRPSPTAADLQVGQRTQGKLQIEPFRNCPPDLCLYALIHRTTTPFHRNFANRFHHIMLTDIKTAGIDFQPTVQLIPHAGFKLVSNNVYITRFQSSGRSVRYLKFNE